MNRSIPLLLTFALALCVLGTMVFFLNQRQSAARNEAMAALRLAEAERASAAEQMERVQQDLRLAAAEQNEESASPSGDTLSRIENTLSRIEERLTALEARGGADRKPVEAEAEDLASLIESLTQLRQELAVQIEENRERNARTLALLKEQNPEAKWGNLQSLIDLWHVDQAQALEKARLLSMEDVMERYGSPTELWSNDKGTNWVYGEGEDPEGGYATEVWLCFQDGLVTMLGVK